MMAPLCCKDNVNIASYVTWVTIAGIQISELSCWNFRIVPTHWRGDEKRRHSEAWTVRAPALAGQAVRSCVFRLSLVR